MAGVTLTGGIGGQTLFGSAGPDVIHADLPDDASRIELLQRVRVGGEAAAGPAQTALIWHAGAVRMLTAGAAPGAGGVTAFTLGPDDRMRSEFAQAAMDFGPGDLMSGAPAVHAFRWQGDSLVLSAGHGVSLSRLDAEGAPELISTAALDWTSGLLYPGALAAYEAGGRLHVLVGGGWDGGLSVLRLGAQGLRTVARVDPHPEAPLAQVADIALAPAGGDLFAITASPVSSGIAVWRLGTGAPVMTDRRGQRDGESGTDLTRARAVEAVTRPDGTWVYAAAEDGRLVTYRLDAAGTLSRSASQPGAHDLAAFRLEGRDFLALTRGANTVEVWEIGPGGRLDPHETLEFGAAARISHVTALARDGRVLLSLTRADRDGVDLAQFGLDGEDTVFGGPGDDVIFGGGGDDVLHGEGGRDTLFGGPGDDRLHGGPGADVLWGGPGADRLWGEGGDDVLHGGAGPDRLWGGPGADRLHGGAGADQLRGGRGDDVLWGGTGPDKLWGGPGNDMLRGGAGPDRLWGGPGNDRLWGDGGDDFLWGGAGDDRLWGGGGDDVLRGGDGDDRLWGGRGNDRLFGGPGDDALFGGPGRDTLWGGTGDDALTGGTGADLFVFAAGEGRNRITDFGDGADRVRIEGASGFAEVRLVARGEDALLIWRDLRVTFAGWDPDDLAPRHFLFD